MENTILVGDYCIGFKSIYGPEIPLMNIKLPILSHPVKGDIVIFKNSVFNNMSMIKRCVATAGDSVKMVNKKLYINGTPSVYESLTKHIDKRVLDFRDNFDEIIVPKKGEEIRFTSDDLHKFEIYKNLFLQLYGDEGVEIQRTLYIDSNLVENYKFQRFGLPNITNHTLSNKSLTYSELFDYIEMIKDDTFSETIYIHQVLTKQGHVINEFKVYENCYFVMGDNRDASNDSRFWGFITDQNLVAMPLFIYYSQDNRDVSNGNNSVRWERIGQLLWK